MITSCQSPMTIGMKLLRNDYENKELGFNVDIMLKKREAIQRLLLSHFRSHCIFMVTG